MRFGHITIQIRIFNNIKNRTPRRTGTDPKAETKAHGAHVNYYVLTGMFAFIVFFSFANAYEPQIDSQLDFSDIGLPIAQFITGIFGIFVANRYGWTTHVFGRAYLALGIGFLLWGIGSTVFIMLVVFGFDFPYPGLPDLFFVPTYFALLFHLSSVTRYFKRKFTKRDILVLVLIPVVINIIYVLTIFLEPSIPGSVPDLLSRQVTIDSQPFELVPADDSNQSEYQQVTVSNITYNLVPVDSYTGYPQNPQSDAIIDPVPLALTNLAINFDSSKITSEFWPPFLAGLFYNSITTLNLAFAILGMTVFRGSILGTAWGVLMIGFVLTSSADIVFDFTSIYADVRTSLAIPLWIFGCMILSYALYLHRKNI